VEEEEEEGDEKDAWGECGNPGSWIGESVAVLGGWYSSRRLLRASKQARVVCAVPKPCSRTCGSCHHEVKTMRYA